MSVKVKNNPKSSISGSSEDIMQSCLKFQRCEAPLCPLDIDYQKRVYLKGEPKCTLGKAIRLKLGKDLPRKGLFPKEFAAIKRWQKKSKYAQKNFIEIGKIKLRHRHQRIKIKHHLEMPFEDF